MDRWQMLASHGRKHGSYIRGDLRGDVLYTGYRYREVSLLFSPAEEVKTRGVDLLAQELFNRGLISGERLNAFLQTLFDEMSPASRWDAASPEEIYAHIHGLRLTCFGPEVLEELRLLHARESRPLTFGGIDQADLMEELLRRSESVLVVLADAALTAQLRLDLQKLACQKVYAAVASEPGQILPEEDFFRQQFPGITCLKDGTALPENTAVLFYGEDGLHHCRGLTCDAVVTAVPVGYCAQALVNGLGQAEPCRIYVPRTFDLTPYVKLTEKSRLTWYHLARLSEAHGREVYSMTAEQIYRTWPDLFLNVYENNIRSGWLPFSVSMEGEGETFALFEQQREEAVKTWLEGFPNVEYLRGYFDENLQPAPICYDASQKQEGILVHGVRVKKAKGANVIPCPKGVTPRKMFRDMDLPGTGLVSNFLFFMTGKLGTLYNDLRADRPLEQADAASGHLDYMLRYEGGKRIETFPLFRKTCIAMDREGQFLFFNFRLGGGEMHLGDLVLRWEKDQVDREDPESPITVYTPYFSCPDRDAHRDTYRKAVGQGRVNLIVLQDRVTCVRRGDVILPSAGVVISLHRDAANALLENLPFLGEGYYDPKSLAPEIRLDHPEEIPADRWERVQWAYGGGLSLILEGEALCDKDMDDWFRREGWMSPLSRQTQESNLHTLAKHPRTAIASAENGDLVILVFSGRTRRSTGADYVEMVRIARALVPDVRTLMNVDGGGSAVLGMTVDGSFMELSCPSTSSDSTVGMVRPVNTVFYIPAGEREGTL